MGKHMMSSHVSSAVSALGSIDGFGSIICFLFNLVFLVCDFDLGQFPGFTDFCVDGRRLMYSYVLLPSLSTYILLQRHPSASRSPLFLFVALAVGGVGFWLALSFAFSIFVVDDPLLLYEIDL